MNTSAETLTETALREAYTALLAENAELKKANRFGLVWEPLQYTTLLTTHQPSTKLTPTPSLNVPPVITEMTHPTPPHMLIEGDNLPALQLLTKTHTNTVDIIYIDPPYNTGNSFVYNDTMVEKSDKYPHSAWLSFMNERLIAARTLMKTTGVIFISIGIEEQAHLKLLCDQIFGEKNFITTISRVTKKSSNVGKHFVSSVDYVLVYSKTRNGARTFAAPSLNTEYDKKFKHQDETGPYVPQALYMTTLGVSKNNRYWVECPDGTLCIPPGVTFPKNPANGEQVESVTPNDKGWRYTKERYLKEPANNYIFKQTTTSPLVTPDGTRSAWNVYTKQYRGTGMVRPRNFIDAYPNRTGTAELKALGVHFDYPKPVNFIKHLLTLTQTPKNAVILDFFAGSGTTGHAVMLMNTEDDGARQCIMVTNNENNIYHTVTIPRLKAALSGKWGDGKPHPPLRGALETFKITTHNN